MWRPNRLSLRKEWQGGQHEPAWGSIIDDINSQKYQTIDKNRLPEDHLPFVHPLSWGEAHTRMYSAHFRSCMDQRGRVSGSMGATAFQFRTLFDQQGFEIHHDDAFRTDIHEGSPLHWDTAALLYERRVAQSEIEELNRALSHGAAYYAGAESRVHRAKGVIPQISQLWHDLKEWEDTAAPEAPTPSDAELFSWHPAALHVLNDRRLFSQDCDPCTFPETWQSREAENHSLWSTSALFHWLQRTLGQPDNPIILTGKYGICVPFYTTLHYILNVCDHMPLTAEQRDARINQGLAVYGRADIRDLTRCIELIAQRLAEAPRPSAAPVVSTFADDLMRIEGWRPSTWMSVDAKGNRVERPVASLQQQVWNVFEGALEDTNPLLVVPPDL
ncbi:hypothetical protein FRC06_008737, partial [Ceratobasidium sp. 370]